MLKATKDDLVYKDIIDGLNLQIQRQDNPEEILKLREQVKHYKKKYKEAKKALGFKSNERTRYY